MLIMAISKGDCITLQQASEELGVSRTTFYHYAKFLGIESRKFPFDRKSYILKTDIDRIKKLADESKQ